MKSVIVGVLAIVMAGAGWFGWTKYQGIQETKFAAQAVQSSSAQTERQLKAKTEDGITFAEYFKRGTATVEDLDQTISKLDAQAWNYKQLDRNVAVTFIEQCKAIIRSEQAETRLLMEENSARESTETAKKDFDEADSATAIDWTRKRYLRASNELIEVLNKQISSINESTGKIARFIAADEAVKSAFGSSKGLSQDTVDTLKKRIAPTEDNGAAKE